MAELRLDSLSVEVNVQELPGLRNGNTIVETDAVVAITNVVRNPLSARNVLSVLDSDDVVGVNRESGPHSCDAARKGGCGRADEVDEL